jgi:transporter family protein
MSWVAYALLGALAAALTAILAKLGVSSIPSNLAVLVRTCVVLVVATAFVAARGEFAAIRDVKGATWAALIFSGIATGVSWLAYFKALQLAPASLVAPLDKLSLPLTVVLAALVLGESLTWKSGLGVALMVVGAVVATRP